MYKMQMGLLCCFGDNQNHAKEFNKQSTDSISTREIGNQLFEFYAIDHVTMDPSYKYESWDFDPSDIDTTNMERIAFDIIMFTLEPYVRTNKTLASFVNVVIEKYAKSCNPYHGLKHALHVFHTMHMLMKSGLIVMLDNHLQLTCYLAALCHDIDHPGLTNRFLVATDDAIAIKFNYVSPLEMHHIATVFGLLAQPCNNIFADMDMEHLYKFKQTFAKLILSTDIAEHKNVLDNFSHFQKDPILLAKIAIKCCDLSHTFSSFQNHLQWVTRLENEFFAQGDRERLIGLQVTPFFERTANGIGRTQNSFFRFIVIPLFREFTTAVPGAAEMLSRVEENEREWSRRISSESDEKYVCSIRTTPKKQSNK